MTVVFSVYTVNMQVINRNGLYPNLEILDITMQMNIYSFVQLQDMSAKLINFQ